MLEAQQEVRWQTISGWTGGSTECGDNLTCWIMCSFSLERSITLSPSKATGGHPILVQLLHVEGKIVPLSNQQRDNATSAADMCAAHQIQASILAGGNFGSEEHFWQPGSALHGSFCAIVSIWSTRRSPSAWSRGEALWCGDYCMHSFP